MAAPTKFLVLSDTHDFEYDASQDSPLCRRQPKVDVVLHCGDLTDIGGVPSYQKALTMLETIDAELKLVIAGNHDLDLDIKTWVSHRGEVDGRQEHNAAVSVMIGPRAEAANVTYLTEGSYTFTLRSGVRFKIFASPYQPAFQDWAFQYKRGEHRWNIPADTDIVMTHGPPHGTLDFANNKHLGCEGLKTAVEVARPILHCFGHIHEGYGVNLKRHDHANGTQRGRDHPVTFVRGGTGDKGRVTVSKGKSTLMINAAMMDARNKPRNAPWLVEIPL